MIPRGILDRVGDRWSVALLTALASRPLRYTEILLQVPGISQKMLTQTLRCLELEDLLLRTVYPTTPPRVDYRLTDSGRDLLTALEPLAGWAGRRVSAPTETRRSA
jgi:DNA-binding HxlR family transcriptional regulator